jgi:MFS family permease
VVGTRGTKQIAKLGPKRLPANRPSRRVLYTMRHISYAWGFGAAWMYITTGAALTQYAKLLDTPEYAFGILAAVPFAGSLLQLPSSYIISRYGHRKLIFTVSGLIHRMLWFAVAAIPLLLPHGASWVALVGIMGASSLAGHVASPGVLAWFGDVVPKPVRGRYFGRRAQLGQISGLVTTVLVGYLLDWSKLSSHLTLQWTLCGMMAGAAILGTIDFLILAPLPDPRPEPVNADIRLSEVLRAPLADRNFRRYLGFAATFTFGVGYVGQYVWLFIFDVVHYTNSQANVLLVSVPLVVAMCALPWWGRVIDKYGRKPVMILGGLSILHGAAVWILLAGPQWWVGVGLAFLVMAAWPGLDLGCMNLLFCLSTIPGTRRQNSSYQAVASVVVAVAGVLSGVFGGLVAKLLGGWQSAFLGCPITYHGLLFIISGVFRLASLLWLRGLDDPGCATVGETARGIASDIAHTLRRWLAFPRRQLVPISRGAHLLAGLVRHAREERARKAA